MLKKFLLKENVLVFLFCMAVIQGPAFSLMDNYDQSTCIDCQTYLGIAKLSLNQSPVRRYRPIVPMLAGSINYIGGRFFNKVHPLSFPGDFPLSFSFFIINNIFVSIWGVLIYRYCKAYGASMAEAIIGLLVMLTCRWTPYIAGIPMVDSLYCVTLGIALLGIKEKKENLIIWAIFLGPFAKEAFIFIAPVIFFFSHVAKPRLLLYFVLSGILVFTFHWLYDHIAGFPPTSGLEANLYHFQYVKGNISRLFGFHGLYDIFSNFGLWILLPLIAFWLAPGYRLLLRQNSEWYMLFFMVSIFVHMILSGFFERMFYLAMPLICMFTALSVSALKKQYFPSDKLV